MPETSKDLKVRLPRDLRLRLHTARLLHGERISDVIQAALVEYFREHGDPDMRGFE